MEKIIWEVRYRSLIGVVRYCKKCSQKKKYICSGQFRINAQRKSLDIWLIYKCSYCDTTWNSEIYSRINPQSLSLERLEKFHRNDSELVRKYGMDVGFLRRNGAEVYLPDYEIIGDEICIGAAKELRIVSQYPCSLKVSTILREKLSLSRKEFEKMLICGEIRSHSMDDLTKCKLNQGIIVLIGYGTDSR